MCDEMPLWFSAFSVNFETFMTSITDKLDKMSSRLITLEASCEFLKKDLVETKASYELLKTDLIETKASYNFLKKDLTKSNHTVERLVDQSLLTDSCEIRISGVPKIFSGDHKSAVEKIFATTDNTHNLQHVTEIRECPEPSKVCPTDKKLAGDTISLAVKTVSPSVRDNIVSKSRLLKDKSAQSIFNSGGNHRVFLSSIWPRPVYELLRAATAKSKSLNYLSPVVRNLVVCLRVDATSPLTPVYADTDLINLQPFKNHG